MYNRYVISQLVLAKLCAGRIVFYTKQACPIAPINSKVEHSPRAWIEYCSLFGNMRKRVISTEIRRDWAHIGKRHGHFFLRMVDNKG